MGIMEWRPQEHAHSGEKDQDHIITLASIQPCKLREKEEEQRFTKGDVIFSIFHNDLQYSNGTKLWKNVFVYQYDRSDIPINNNESFLSFDESSCRKNPPSQFILSYIFDNNNKSGSSKNASNFTHGYVQEWYPSLYIIFLYFLIHFIVNVFLK